MPDAISDSNPHRRLGAVPIADRRSRFRLWAPGHRSVALRLLDQAREISMERAGAGYHVAEVAGVTAGQRYCYRLGGEIDRPDPASRFQPSGVHGPSEVVSSDFPWSDQDWAGIALDEFIIYELHVGTFSRSGTFGGVVERLDELVDLGVTAIELMPLADAPGRWNWGYDGVCLFAPNRNYGRPEDLKRLVDAAHARGLAVILDVVYNHFGSEGNYLGEFGSYLSPRHTTPWGAAPNFDDPVHGAELRRFFIANVIYWLDEYHFDALRVDAIHCMRDHSDRHVVFEIGEAVDRWKAETGRPACLIAETNVYDRRMIQPQSEGGIGFDAEWCDDFLHSVCATVRPGTQLSHRVYRPATDLEQVLRYGYIYSGSMWAQRGRDRPTSAVPTGRLIFSIQNHDFVGNHPLGRRLHQLTSLPTQAAAAALLLLCPAIPMLFMGEEFACPHPFRFFVDFGDKWLREAVVAGRRGEYPQHDWSSGLLPTDRRAFSESKIGTPVEGDTAMRNWYQSLIRLRRAWIANGLLSQQNLTIKTDLHWGLYVLQYSTDHAQAVVTVRLSAQPEPDDVYRFNWPGEILLDSRAGQSDAIGLLANHAVISIAPPDAGFDPM